MDSIIVINAGSSSIKFSLYKAKKELSCLYKGLINLSSNPELLIKREDGEIELSQILKNKEAIKEILRWIKEKKIDLVAAGHRVVHGGDFDRSVVVSDEVIDKLTKLIPFSPLHQPYNLEGISLFQKEYPDLFQTISFDSAFHSTCNPIAQSYALPKYLTESGIRRYGFHGLSYEYISSVLSKYMDEKIARGKLIVAHLGSGSTMCALENKKSLATSIGLTSMGGLPMATRSGEVDPYLAVFLVDQGWDTKKIQNLFYKESGLLGVSQISGDMKELLKSNHPDAKKAIDIFIHRISIFTGSLAADLQGVDGFIFTGGIGENSSEIRERVIEKIGWLDFQIDRKLNEEVKKEAKKISTKSSKAIWVIPTYEEIMIAKHAYELYLKK
jgi:acetate kinase